MPDFIYEHEHTREISFPLGGIGTGSIGLSGDARLIDWEIFNRPSKGSVNGCSHFAIRAERGGTVLDARILNGPFQGSLTGDYNAAPFRNFGFGARREFLAGLPHFRTCRFEGRFPVATVTLQDPRFPGEVRITAFNPLIPMNDRDSGLPVAMFEITVRNTTDQPIDYTIVQVVQNPFLPSATPELRRADGTSTFTFIAEGVPSSSVDYGQMTFGTDAPDISHQHAWYRGNWFDSLEVYWGELRRPGVFKDRRYRDQSEQANDHALLAARLHALAHEEVAGRFVIAWHNPNCHKYWTTNNGLLAEPRDVPDQWRNYYATQWPDAPSVAAFALTDWQRLLAGTNLFRDSLFASTLPHSVLDAVASNISILKSATVLRLEDGTFYGWEGCHPDAGSCEGSCTHVWNYQQALPFLFPALERSMRTVDYRENQDPIGGMAFRIQLPLAIGTSDERPCVDGQFGNVMKLYRDWKISGDDGWLRALWPAVKASIDYAWHPDNLDRWDPDQTGVLRGRQHHTLDMELFGPSSWLCGFYLGALRAGAAIATHLGDQDAVTRYTRIYEAGRSWVDANLFNGTYFQQKIDLSDRSILDAYTTSRGSRIVKGSIYDLYWDDELEELKYQIGDGCIIDQVLAQWHANLYGLGDLFDPAKTTSALRAILKHNYKPNLGDVANPCRVFGVEGEAGTVICAWPDDVRRPAIPVPYAQETMHGFEYAFGATLMQYGMLREGVAIFKAVRDRYNGRNRNPFNEIECGSNYARSMASYAGLLVLSGFQADLPRGEIRFDPKLRFGRAFQCFWSAGQAWGEFRLTDGQADLAVHYGDITLQALGIPLPAGTTVQVTRDGQPVASSAQDNLVRFTTPCEVSAGQRLVLAAPALSLADIADWTDL